MSELEKLHKWIVPKQLLIHSNVLLSRNDDNVLNIYGQKNDTGTINATGDSYEAGFDPEGSAGIGTKYTDYK